MDDELDGNRNNGVKIEDIGQRALLRESLQGLNDIFKS